MGLKLDFYHFSETNVEIYTFFLKNKNIEISMLIEDNFNSDKTPTLN